MTSRTPKTERMHFLDCVRGVAALSVVLEHAGDHSFASFRHVTHGLFSFGKFGVAIFFLTSGFVIPFSLERTGSLGTFWVNRIFRLYPLYWLSLAITVGLCFVHGAGITSGITDLHFSDHLARNSLVNATMLQGFLRIPNAEGLYYTLTMELGFYVAFSILYGLKLQRRSLPIAWGMLVIVTLTGIGIPLLTGHRVPLAGLFYLLNLAMGTAIYRTYTGELAWRPFYALLTGYGVFTCLEIFCNYVLIRKNDPVEVFTFTAVAAPWLGAFITFFLFYRLPFRYPRSLVWLGMISYSVYLLHPFCLLLVPQRFPLASFTVTIVSCILLSSVTYVWLERPGISLGKRLLSQSFGQPRRKTEALDQAQAAITI